MKASKAQFNRFLKAFVEMMKREKWYGWTSGLSFILFVLTLTLPIWKILPMSTFKPFIPLHYNVLFGIDRFGPWYHIFWLPAIGFLVWICNTICAVTLYHREKLMATLCIIGSFVVQVILLCATTLIVLVNL